MFNRKLEMKVVKDTKDETAAPKKNPSEIAAAVQSVTQTVIKEGGKVVVTYVLLDTLRKFILIGLTNKA